MTGMFIQREDGKLKKFKPYAKIICDTKEDLEFVKAAVDFYSGWRDINESLPEPRTWVLLSFANREEVAIGQRIVSEDGSYAFHLDDLEIGESPCTEMGLLVNAWIPLPKPYRRKQEV